jgi:hypothetical protein
MHFFFTVRIYFLEVCVFLYLLPGELFPLHAFLLCEFISLKCAFSLHDTERVYCLTVGMFLIYYRACLLPYSVHF